MYVHLVDGTFELFRAYYGSPEYDRGPPSSDRRYDPHQHRGSSHDQAHGQRRPHYKKRSWLENLGEIFD